MSVDYARLLEELGIDTDPKRETARRLYIHCPLCGDDDQSSHLGIMKDGSAWGCLRNGAHRGFSPFRLIRALSGWSYDQIAAYVGGQVTPDSLDDLERKVEDMNRGIVTPADPFRPVDLPREAHPFGSTSPLEIPFLTYLEEARGFGIHACHVARRYKLHWCMSGRFEWRILLPVLDDMKVWGFTARSIGKTGLRYIAEPQGDQIKRAVYNGHRCVGGLLLVICEGPMDALKVDFFGRRYGISALALMGTSATPEQEERIWRLARRYNRVAILLDSTALVEALALQSQLRSINPTVADLPKGAKDPGDLTPLACAKWGRRTLKDLQLW